jgi:hypothetical protein
MHNLKGRNLPQTRYTTIHVDKDESHPFKIEIYFKTKDGFFYLSIYELECEHKGHSKKPHVKTSAEHMTKSETKMLNVILKRGEQHFSFKTLQGNIYSKAKVTHLIKKLRKNMIRTVKRSKIGL